MEWFEQDRWKALVKTVMNLRILQHFGKFWSSYKTASFSRRAQL
jgi:hypothetical protein